MTNDITDYLADRDFGPEFGGGDEGRRVQPPRPPFYKVINANPQKPGEAITPGIQMITKEGENKKTETVPSLTAVILFQSAARVLGRGTGKDFKVVCSSNDGISPAVSIDNPLCRKATSQDVAKIISGWKGMDKAKVDAKLADVAPNGVLNCCGIAAGDGSIPLCPYARKDEATGQKGACKPKVYVRAFDIERNREFEMDLSGKSIESWAKFISPFWEFIYFLRTKKHPCFAYQVKLSVAPNGAYWYLNVSNPTPLASKELIDDMENRAYSAREAYLKRASYLSKEKYQEQRVKKKASGADQGDLMVPIEPPPSGPVSFAEDDIQF